MITPEIEHYLKLADESRDVARILLETGHPRFSAAQSYYTIFYPAQAMLLTKGMTFSKHSAVVAAYGKEFAKTGLPDPKFHRYIIKRRNCARPGIMVTKGKKSAKNRQENPFNGRGNSWRR